MASIEAKSTLTIVIDEESVGAGANSVTEDIVSVAGAADCV